MMIIIAKQEQTLLVVIIELGFSRNEPNVRHTAQSWHSDRSALPLNSLLERSVSLRLAVTLNTGCHIDDDGLTMMMVWLGVHRFIVSHMCLPLWLLGL